jgi:uncharacterized protein (TIGR04255 family)
VRLPDAPLLEVVFELRWKVAISDDSSPAPFGYDPGFDQLKKNFDEALSKEGYARQEQITQPGPTVVYAVAKRYRKEDEAFPLIQIGHGLFACNYSTDYDWGDFESFCKHQLGNLIASYPVTAITELKPSRVELRYIDIFNSDLLKHSSFMRFLNENSQIDFDGFPFLSSAKFSGDDSGLIRMRRDLADPSSGWFQFDAASAKNEEDKAVLLTSRVVKEAAFDELWQNNLQDAAALWLGQAHSVTSEFFKSFVSADLMKSFGPNKQEGS